MPADTYLAGDWAHLAPTCPLRNTSAWEGLRHCPAGRRLVRLAVDDAVPFASFEGRAMHVRHAGSGPPTNATLALPSGANAAASTSVQVYGCVDECWK